MNISTLTEEEEKEFARLGRWDLLSPEAITRLNKVEEKEQVDTKNFDIPNKFSRMDIIGQNGNDGLHYEEGKNNGGDTDYYQLKPSWKDGMDIIEDRGMNYSQGNILKVAMTFNVGRHKGTNYERELNKIIFFAKRELKRINSNE